MTSHFMTVRALLASSALALLAACGGGGSDGGTGATYTVGGQLSGLLAGQSVTVQNNGTDVQTLVAGSGDALTLRANGAFTFARSMSANAGYAVTVSSQPAGQRCTVANGTGRATANVTHVSVTCQDLAGGGVRPVYLTDTYHADRAGLLAQANAQGASGYAYLSGMAFGSSGFLNLYVKDVATTYTWEALDLPATATALQTQLNAQGARGFALGTFMTDGAVNSVYYVRDAQGPASYSYELLTSQTTSANFLTQANAQGARGFFFLGQFAIGGSTVAIYGKDSSSARYSYALQAPTGEAAPDVFIAQANAQGQQGYRFIGEYVFSGNPGTDAFKNIYVKDTTQAATFDHQALAETGTGPALLTQANDQGLQGYFYGGATIFFPSGYGNPGVTRNLYAKATNCTGAVMCRASSPL